MSNLFHSQPSFKLARRKGLSAREAAFAVKKYKSHRTIGTVAEIRDYISAQEDHKYRSKAVFRL